MAESELIIVQMLEPFTQSPFQAWPLHMTVVPWFNAPNTATVINTLQTVTKSYKPLRLKVGKRAFFGARKLAVRTIQKTDKFQKLHDELLAAIYSQGWQVKGRYTGDHFIPHVTSKQGRDVTDKQLILNKLHIVEALPQNYRRPVGELRLNDD